jgi:hypothetical protein
MNRGDQREGIFRDVEDRQKLPPTPGEICQKRARQVYLSNPRYGRVHSQAIWHAGLANQRIEPMRRSAFRLVVHSGAADALLLMAHPGR